MVGQARLGTPVLCRSRVLGDGLGDATTAPTMDTHTQTKEHESHHTYTRQIAYAVNMWLYSRVIDLSQKAGGVHNPLMYEQRAHEVQLEKEESHS